jgi:phosphomethylpyrimidine synthase
MSMRTRPHFRSMKITQGVRDYAAKHSIGEETAAVVQGLREKAEEFRKSGGEIYRRA